jgi:hypothetical protein
MANETYHADGRISDDERLRSLGEVQNRIVAQLARLLPTVPGHCPDDMFAKLLFHQSDTLGADPQALVTTIEVAQSRAAAASLQNRRHACQGTASGGHSWHRSRPALVPGRMDGSPVPGRCQPLQARETY